MDVSTSTTPAAVALGSGDLFVDRPRPTRRSLLRLSGKVAFWHQGKRGTWGVLKSDSKTKFHVHLTEILNRNSAPDVGERVEFTPRPARKPGELRRAVSVFVVKEQKEENVN